VAAAAERGRGGCCGEGTWPLSSGGCRRGRGRSAALEVLGVGFVVLAVLAVGLVDMRDWCLALAVARGHDSAGPRHVP
jgi:hypothetical protein